MSSLLLLVVISLTEVEDVLLLLLAVNVGLVDGLVDVVDGLVVVDVVDGLVDVDVFDGLVMVDVDVVVAIVVVDDKTFTVEVSS